MNEILFQEILDESGRGYRRFKNTIRGQQCVPQDSLDWWIASAAFELGRAAGMREEVSAAVAVEREWALQMAEKLYNEQGGLASGLIVRELRARSNSAAGQTETP